MSACATAGCLRAPVPTSATGIVHSCCADHERELLSAFGEHWADQARAGVLRTAIVGGVPIDTPLSGPGQEAQGVAPSRIAGDPGVTAADDLPGKRLLRLAGRESAGQPDGDLAGSRRAIAQATPGRTPIPSSGPAPGADSPLGSRRSAGAPVPAAAGRS